MSSKLIYFETTKIISLIHVDVSTAVSNLRANRDDDVVDGQHNMNEFYYTTTGRFEYSTVLTVCHILTHYLSD